MASVVVSLSLGESLFVRCKSNWYDYVHLSISNIQICFQLNCIKVKTWWELKCFFYFKNVLENVFDDNPCGFAAVLGSY